MMKIGVSTVAVAALVLALAAPTTARADDTGSVSGTVTAGAGAIVDVTLWDDAGTEVDDLSDDQLGDDGSYTFTDVAAGNYTVSFSDEQDDPYPTRFYNNVVTEDLTDPRITYFAVGTGAVTGIDGIVDTASFSNPVTPTISGARLFGKTLTVDTGEWPEDPDFDIQWFRGSSAIPDATDDTYVIAAADLGKSLHVQVTASEDGFDDVTLTSASVFIPAGAKVTGAKPTIAGVVKVGKTVKAVPGAWKPKGVKFHYQWVLAGKPIAKATKAKLKLKPAFAGKKLRVVVTGGKLGVGAAVKTSKAIKVAR